MKKRFYFRIILCIVLVLGIGYALITSNLSITGTSKLKGQTWDVYFANLTYDASSNNSASIDEDNTTIRFNIDLNNPGADYTFYFDVFNDGTLDAMLDTIEVQGIADELKKYLDITTSYVDGVEVSKYDLLEAGEHETLEMNLKYSQNLNINELPDENLDFNLALAVKYDQADNNAVARAHGVTNQVPPTVSENGITVVDGNVPWKKSVIVSYNITDTDVIKNVNYCISNSSCTPNIRGMVSNNVFNYEFPSSTEEKLICMNGEDIFGNKSTTTCSSLYLVDKDAPNVTSFYTTKATDSIQVYFYASDYVSGIDKYYYSKDNGENFVSSTNSNYTFSDLEDGKYQLVAYAEDIAGNKSVESRKIVNILNNNVYATLYSDGVMVFNEDGDVDGSKTLVKQYNITNTNYTSESQVPWIADGNITNITTVDFEERTRPISTAYWFSGATNLTQVLHSSNLDTFAVTNMRYMFQKAKSLTTLDVSTWDTSSVTNMLGLFKGDNDNVMQLREIRGIGNWDTSKVTNMGTMFEICENLISIDVSNWDTSSVTDMGYMFNRAKSLTSLDVANWNTSKVTEMSWMFAETTNLRSLDVSKWDTSNVRSMYVMFYKASSLTTLDVSKWNTSKVTNMAWMFSNMPSLTNVNLSKWNTSRVTDMSYMFAWSPALGNLDLSKWDTRAVTIFTSMFVCTAQNASSKVIYYGPNSTNLYDNRGSSDIYATFTYKE